MCLWCVWGTCKVRTGRCFPYFEKACAVKTEQRKFLSSRIPNPIGEQSGSGGKPFKKLLGIGKCVLSEQRPRGLPGGVRSLPALAEPAPRLGTTPWGPRRALSRDAQPQEPELAWA